MLHKVRMIGQYWLCLAVLVSLHAPRLFAGPSARTADGKGVRLIAPSVEQKLRFEKNSGQTDERVQFLGRGLGYKLFLTSEGAVFALRVPGEPAKTIVRLELPTASLAQGEGQELLEGRSYYLTGRSRGVSEAPSYSRVRYSEVYPGIDLVYYGSDGRLEYDFVVAPGADPSAIRLRFTGADAVRVDEGGGLVIRVGQTEMRQQRPLTYQETTSGKHEIPSRFVLLANGEVNFEIGAYDDSRALYIDPILDYSSFLGAENEEAGNAVAVDSEGNVYVIGSTESADFPVSANAFQSAFGGDDSDVFVSKFRPDGRTLAFSTFLGSESNDVGLGIALDGDNNIYVTGYTESEFFPVNGFQATFAGEQDCFVAKLSSDGANATFSTYLGHGDEDRCTDIAVDASGNVYVAGFTRSLDFPTSDSPFQGTQNGGRDGFVTKLNPEGTGIVYSTFLGGAGDDLVNGLAVDDEGVVYVTGDTKSEDFPLSSDARQNIRRAETQDAFVTRLSADGGTLVYSSLLGGSSDDVGNAIALDWMGNIYVAGMTRSADFPFSGSSFQRFLAGEEDAFLAVFDSSGRELVYATFLGGVDNDSATDVAVDAAGNAVVVGFTSSEDFPLTTTAVLPEFRGDEDAFVVTLNSSGTGLLHSSYFGGQNDDRANGVALDAMGEIYFTGSTKSDNFPVSEGAFQTDFIGDGLLSTPTEAFVVKLRRDETDAPLVSVSSATFSTSVVAAGSITSSFGQGLSATTEIARRIPLPTELAGVTVRIIDSAGQEFDAPLFFISPGQINFFIPEDVAAGRATVVVERDGSAVAAGNIMVRDVQPGLFSMNASGEGVAAALVATAEADGSISRQPVFSGRTVGSFVPQPIDLGDESDEVVLELFGTGIRGASDIRVTVDGQEAEVLFAGPQRQFVGLDQVNVRLDRSLIGRGTVAVVVIADGRASNTVLINIQ